MKRILFMMFLIGLNTLNAASMSSAKDVYKLGETIQIKVKGLEYHPKNWIALYPKGKSSAGSNVIRWKWTKETTDGVFFFKTVGNVVSKPYLPKGDYEARVMYNNSYTPAVSVSFSVGDEKPQGTAKLISSKDVYKLGEDIVIKVKDLEYHPKNWIAIYPKGKSSAGSNVIRWKWTKETTDGEFVFKTVGNVVSKPYLPEGEYEARVMYNNSYTPEAVVGFSVKEKVPPKPHGTVSIKSQKAQYIIPEVAKIEIKTTDSLDKRVFKVYQKNENGEWKEISGYWYPDLSDKINETFSLNFLPIGEYEVRVYYADKLLNKTEFKIKAVTDIVDTVRQYCKGKERNNDAIICPSFHDNLAYAIHYKNYTEHGSMFHHLLYDLDTIHLDDNLVRVNKGDQEIERNYPNEYVTLKRLKATPIYIYKIESFGADENRKWSFQYQSKELLHFSSNDTNRALYNIHTTNKGKNLVLTYESYYGEPYGTITETYDISDPTVAKLIDRQIKPL